MKVNIDLDEVDKVVTLSLREVYHDLGWVDDKDDNKLKKAIKVVLGYYCTNPKKFLKEYKP